MAKHTISDLYQMQSMPLNIKVRMTQNRIRGWVDEYGEDGVYVSFSGGKDSTVLLDIVRKMYPNVLAVFVDTGLEYPEIRDFVKTKENIVWLKPEMNFRKVIETYGYPIISKEVSKRVHWGKRYLEEGKVGYWAYQSLTQPVFTKDGKRSPYDKHKYGYLLDAPFKVSDNCCKIMKKDTAHKYGKQTGRKPIIATMACESQLRKMSWLKNGCNAFDATNPASTPMSFWTEQDVLLYIKENNLPICSVYGEIVEVEGKSIPVKDSDMRELFNLDRPMLKTTGCERTGCMFCGYGCHLEKPGEGRFLKMKKTHPKQYDYIMRPSSEGGLNYKEVIDWINEHGGFNIEY